MAKLEIKLNSQGVRELLKSAEIQQTVMSEAEKIAEKCGGGYEAESRIYPERIAAVVKAETYTARRDNLKNNTLLKALGGGI